MRDRDRLFAEGRHDPNSPEQQREHPYDFVALPPQVRKLDSSWLDRRRPSRSGLWVELTLQFTALQPIAIGSGLIGAPGGQPVRLCAANSAGAPTVPGSSLKGSIRANYEAITTSCVWNGRDEYYERAEKLPEALRPRGASRDVRVRVEPPPQPLAARCRVNSGTHSASQLSLCPACGLFGALGYRGRVAFEDALVVEGAAADALTICERVPALNSGQPHRIGYATLRGQDVTVTTLWGRRVPLLWRELREGDPEAEGVERVQAIRPTAVLQVRVSFMDVQACELGGFLLATGWGHRSEILRLGGFKPVGFGLVQPRIAAIHRRSQRLAPPAEPGAAEEIAREWVAEFGRWDRFWETGLAELTDILNRPAGAAHAHG